MSMEDVECIQGIVRQWCLGTMRARMDGAVRELQRVRLKRKLGTRS